MIGLKRASRGEGNCTVCEGNTYSFPALEYDLNHYPCFALVSCSMRPSAELFLFFVSLRNCVRSDRGRFI